MTPEMELARERELAINDAIEVRVFDNVQDKGTLIQSIPQLHKARFLVRGKQGLLYVASVSHLWCIQAVDISKQREHLLQEENFQLALKLTVGMIRTV